MNFKTHNNKNIDTDGSSVVGTINVEYSTLTKVFGNPTPSDGCKSDAEWEIEFSDGTVATIYNWKNGKNYRGSSGLPKTKITCWHIGGFTKKSVSLVKQALGLKI